jgi:hypothetical protein
MNVETGAEAALFTEKEYINGIAVTVRGKIQVCNACKCVKGRAVCSLKWVYKRITGRKKGPSCHAVGENGFAVYSPPEREEGESCLVR